MKWATSSKAVLILGLGLTLPAFAQQPSALAEQADADGDGFVNAEEAGAHDERRFDQLSDGGTEISLEQFRQGILGAEAVSAEAGTRLDADSEFEQADADGSFTLSREEWVRWRQERFEQAAGAEGIVEAGLYRSVDSSGAMADVDAGGESDIGATEPSDTPAADEPSGAAAGNAGTESTEGGSETEGAPDAADAGSGEGAGDTTTEDAGGDTTTGEGAGAAESEGDAAGGGAAGN